MGRPVTKKPSPVDAGDAVATRTVTKAPAVKIAPKKSGSKRHRSAYNIFVAEVSPAIASTLREEGKKDKMMTVVAQQWKALEDKSKYHKMANEEKKQSESR